MEKIIKTERLLLRKLNITDAVELFKTTGDSDVMKYWIGGADSDIKNVEKRINYINLHWNKFGFGDWGVFNSKKGELIGFAGLHYIDNMNEVNIGYALKKSEWRKGFACEICNAILKFAFEFLKLNEIVAVIWPENTASISLIEKCEFRFYKKITWCGNDRVVYIKTTTNLHNEH